MLLSSGFREHESGECWSAWWLFRRVGDKWAVDASAPVEDVAESFLIAASEAIDEASKRGVQVGLVAFEHYGGPGRAFVHRPSVRWSRSYVLIRQRGGLDV